jgi:hypothetical protein
MVTTVRNPQWTQAWDEAFRSWTVPVPTVTVANAAVDCTRVLLPMSIRHGRSDVAAQPDAPALSFTVLGSVPWGRNDPVVVETGGRRRFSGFVDALDVTYAGGELATSVRCIGWQAKAGAVRPSIPPRTTEDDVARMRAWFAALTAAYPHLTTRVVGDPTVDLVGQDVDGGHTVLELAYRVTDSTGGLLWQDRNGTLVYGTASHRIKGKGEVFIGECDVLDGLTWEKSAGTLINRVRVTYGPIPADGSAQAAYVAEDTASIAAEGRHEVQVSTMLATERDATLLANLILFRRARAYWSMPNALTVLTDDLGKDAYGQVLDLDVGSLLLVPVAHSPGVPGALVEWVVEGWVETWGTDGHRIQYALSDRQRFGLTAVRTVGELAAGFTVATAGALTIRNALFKEVRP